MRSTLSKKRSETYVPDHRDTENIVKRIVQLERLFSNRSPRLFVRLHSTCIPLDRRVKNGEERGERERRKKKRKRRENGLPPKSGKGRIRRMKATKSTKEQNYVSWTNREYRMEFSGWKVKPLTTHPETRFKTLLAAPRRCDRYIPIAH